MIEALDIQVRGIVQGVGFRPFIYRLAQKYLIKGWVLNATDGVFIHAEGEAKHLDEFVLEISENAPAAAQVHEIDLQEVPLEDFESFEIRFSDEGSVEKTTLISPDLATCKDCARELFDEDDRRFRYPFINCTNCGPRFTIIDALPYDRKSTSMKDFPMCSQCQSEYENPLDRRFHAQPDACFKCGPHISWRWSNTEKSSESRRSKDNAGTRGRKENAGSHDDKECAYEAVADTSAFGLVTPDGSERDSSKTDEVQWGITREESDAILAKAVSALKEGNILAVKGLGGFHLVCDATNEKALARLRERKRRKGQAFAVMMENSEEVKRFCEVNEVEESLLSGSQRPIVLLKKRPDAQFAKGLADGLSELGVMLPYTPLQHLLIHDFKGMLVMTSANIHDEPIVIDDEEAYRVLGGVADAFLGHDRAIEARYDDSVVRVIRAADAGYSIQFIRRARGYAPMPLALPEGLSTAGSGPATTGAPSTEPATAIPAATGASSTEPATAIPATTGAPLPAVFATGPEQKNTFCLTREGEAFVSQHIGDMENAETFDAWLEAKRRYERLFEIAPRVGACDKHPEYLTSKWAHEQALSREKDAVTRHDLSESQDGLPKQKLPVVEVQHHHAHIVSVMAENKIENAVIGVAFDGTGYGTDGNIWGGEVLLSNRETFERFANFIYVPMPGGAAAIKHPLRMAYGVLWTYDLLEHPAAQAMIEQLGPTAALCEQMIEKGLNSPLTSSVGRLFDAASALLGICVEPRYEGEGAILLEAAMAGSEYSDSSEGKSADQSVEKKKETDSETIDSEPYENGYRIDIIKNTATKESTAQDTSVLLFDAAPAFEALLDDRANNVALSIISRRFHDAFVMAIVDACQIVRTMYQIDIVALSGGVFMNRYLIERALEVLTAEGFTVAINRELPPNDGCISFGQAVVVLATNNE